MLANLAMLIALMFKPLFLVGLVFGLSACGQKGPLILPSEAEVTKPNMTSKGEAQDKSTKHKQSSNI